MKHVEELETKFAEFKNCAIPARHFQARLFPRPLGLTQPEGIWIILCTGKHSRMTTIILPIPHFHTNFLLYKLPISFTEIQRNSDAKR